MSSRIVLLFLIFISSCWLSQLHGAGLVSKAAAKSLDEEATVHLPLPPRNLMFMVHKMGYMDFLKQGHSNFELLKEFGLNLETPDSHLLDMGSGYGRLLAGIIVGGIDFKGNYTGMDILKRYNTAGKIQPDVYTIPANDRTYSFVSLFSVFTHMHEEEILRYLSEFYRVLRTNGKVVATIFLYNSDRLDRAISTGYGAYSFNDHTRIKNVKDPLFAIVFEEKWFMSNIIQKSGFDLEKVLYGSAIGDPLNLNKKSYTNLFQDLLVLKKT